MRRTIRRPGSGDGRVRIEAMQDPGQAREVFRDPAAYWYAALAFAHLAFQWIVPYFPTQDGPSHQYNLAILSDLLNGGREWGAYYGVRPGFASNLGFHAVALPLLKFLSPAAAERVFLSLYVLLLAGGVPRYIRGFGMPAFPISFLVFPLIWNFSLLMGSYSYVAGVALLLLFLSVVWNCREHPRTRMFLLHNGLGIVLYLFHPVPFGVFLLGVWTLLWTERDGARLGRRGIRAVLWFLPCLALAFWSMRSTLGALPRFSYLGSGERWISLAVDLFTLSGVNLSPWQLAPVSLVMVLYWSRVWFSAKEAFRRWRTGEEFEWGERFLWGFVGALLAVYTLLPYDLFGIGNSGMFNQRLPWVVALVSLPLLESPAGRVGLRRRVAPFAAVCGILFLCNSWVLAGESRKVSEYTRGIAADLPRGSVIVGYKPARPAGSRVDPLLHAVSYYGLALGCLDAGNYEAVDGWDYFPVKFRSPELFPSLYEIEVRPDTIDWSRYPAVRYLVAWEIREEDRRRLGEQFVTLWEEGRTSVWGRGILPGKASPGGGG